MPSTTASLPRDHLPGLERVGDDPEEPLAGPAALRVDVVLELVDVARLEPDAVHLVARVALERVQLAQHPVLHEEVHVGAQPSPPRALEPAVVGLLVRDLVVLGPARERRPAARVVAAGVPAERALDGGAAAAVAMWSSQSRSAYGAPYSCHGRPQCRLPPRNSKAIMWMWASRKPRVSPYGNGWLNGLPLTFRSISGYFGQPAAALPSATVPSPSSGSSVDHAALVGRPPLGGGARLVRGLTAGGEELRVLRVEEVLGQRRGLQPVRPRRRAGCGLEAAVRDRVLRFRPLRRRGGQRHREQRESDAPHDAIL